MAKKKQTAFGIAMRNFTKYPEMPDAKALIDYGVRMEKLGYESLWAWDHILLGVDPNFPIHESLAILTAVAARTETEYLERCGEADGLLVQYGAITRRVLDGLPRVRVLVRYGVGVDGIDLAAATDHGVPVVNVPDYGTDEVANHAVALLLALARKINRLDRQTRSGGWDVFRIAR